MLSARGEGTSRKQSQQAQGMTGKGGGQIGGGVGKDHVIAKGRRKGGYELATGPAAGARALTVGVAAAGGMRQRNADVVLKCGTGGHALLVCWHCLEMLPECPPTLEPRFWV